MAIRDKKLPVALLGSGYIGMDLLKKIIRSPHLTCGVIFARTRKRYLERLAAKEDIKIVSDLPAGFSEYQDEYAVVFDATSADVHREYTPIFKQLDKTIINLTPEPVGELCIPTLNLEQLLIRQANHFNMISCSGQAGIPIAKAIYDVHPELEYLELFASMASDSVGTGTRNNIDEYIETTEAGLKTFLHQKLNCKVMVMLNYFKPSVNMKVTIYVKITNPDLAAIKTSINRAITKIQHYVPDYKMVVEPRLDQDYVMIMLEVRGNGDFLPKHAGNLDIINCAALATAEQIANNNSTNKSSNLRMTNEPSQ